MVMRRCSLFALSVLCVVVFHAASAQFIGEDGYYLIPMRNSMVPQNITGHISWSIPSAKTILATYPSGPPKRNTVLLSLPPETVAIFGGLFGQDDDSSPMTVEESTLHIEFSDFEDLLQGCVCNNGFRRNCKYPERNAKPCTRILNTVKEDLGVAMTPVVIHPDYDNLWQQEWVPGNLYDDYYDYFRFFLFSDSTTSVVRRRQLLACRMGTGCWQGSSSQGKLCIVSSASFSLAPMNYCWFRHGKPTSGDECIGRWENITVSTNYAPLCQKLKTITTFPYTEYINRFTPYDFYFDGNTDYEDGGCSWKIMSPPGTIIAISISAEEAVYYVDAVISVYDSSEIDSRRVLKTIGLGPADEVVRSTFSKAFVTRRNFRTFKLIVRSETPVFSSGSLETSCPLFNRPNTSGTTSTVAAYYKNHTFTVRATGGYELSMNADFNSFLVLYRTSFNPSAPLGSRVAADDNSGGGFDGKQARIRANLTAGIQYILVATSSASRETGFFTVRLTGPGYVDVLQVSSCNEFCSLTNQFVTLPSVKFGGSFTIETKVRVDAPTGYNARVCDFGNGEYNNNVLIALEGDKISYEAYNGNQSPDHYQGQQTITIGRWMHVLWRARASSGRTINDLIIDGNRVFTGTSNYLVPTVSRLNNFIAKSNWQADPLASLSLQWFNVWGQALSNQEMDLARNGSINSINRQPILAYVFATNTGACGITDLTKRALVRLDVLRTSCPVFLNPLRNGVATYYATYTFRVRSTGQYVLSMTADVGSISFNVGFDSFLVLYQTSFNPSAPNANRVIYDDDSGGDLQARITTSLTAGKTYILVACTYDVRTAGFYEVRINGPGYVDSLQDGRCNELSVYLSDYLGSSCSSFVRPLPAVNAFSGTSSGVSTYYKTYTFKVQAEGQYDLNLKSNFDTFLCLYRTSFNPLAPLTNQVAVDNDSSGRQQARIRKVLTAGTTYVLVACSFGTRISGAYRVQLTGVGAVDLLKVSSCTR